MYIVLRCTNLADSLRFERRFPDSESDVLPIERQVIGAPPRSRTEKRLVLNQTGITYSHQRRLAEGEGIEPPFADSKTAVLPLDEPSKLADRVGIAPTFAVLEAG